MKTAVRLQVEGGLMHKKYYFFIGAIALGLSACSTISRPCLEGGEPPRDPPTQVQLGPDGLPVKLKWRGTRHCFQRKGPGGAYVNHGRFSEYYPSGKIAIHGEYKMGKRHGKWLEYDAEGKVISERWFEDGRETDTRLKKIGLQPLEQRSVRDVPEEKKPEPKVEQ